MKPRDWLMGVAAVAILAAAAYVWLAPAGVQRAPDITVTTVEGRKIALEKLRGRPLLVTFWATTCPGCLKEMPHLIELYHDYAPRGFELVAIAMPYDPPNQVLAMVERKSIPYPVALDPQGEATAAFGNVRLTPTSFLIAPDGRIVKHKIGEMDMERVRAQIDRMLARAAAAARAETDS